MTVRRVITGIVDGVSRVVEDAPAPQAAAWTNLWMATPEEPLGHDPGVTGDMTFTPGSVHWRLYEIPPIEVIRTFLASNTAADFSGLEITADGFHTTATIDYVYVLDGDVTLLLDEDEQVALHPGDCVVQRQTHHAWHNYSDSSVHLLVVMVGTG